MRESRKAIAEKTLEEIEQGFYAIHNEKISIKNAVQHSVESTLLYRESQLETFVNTKSGSRPEYSITTVNRSTLQCPDRH